MHKNGDTNGINDGNSYPYEAYGSSHRCYFGSRGDAASFNIRSGTEQIYTSFPRNERNLPQLYISVCRVRTRSRTIGTSNRETLMFQRIPTCEGLFSKSKGILDILLNEHAKRGFSKTFSLVLGFESLAGSTNCHQRDDYIYCFLFVETVQVITDQ